MPIRGMPGICPAGGGAAGGATGGGGARFVGTDIILGDSRGPRGWAVGACVGGAGGYTGVARNAWEAPPPGPYDAGGAGAWGAAGSGSGGPDRGPGPNKRVSPPESRSEEHTS